MSSNMKPQISFSSLSFSFSDSSGRHVDAEHLFRPFAMAIFVEGRGQSELHQLCTAVPSWGIFCRYRGQNLHVAPPLFHLKSEILFLRPSVPSPPLFFNTSGIFILSLFSLSLSLFCVGFGQQIISASSSDLAAIYSEAAVATATAATLAAVFTHDTDDSRRTFGDHRGRTF